MARIIIFLSCTISLITLICMADPEDSAELIRNRRIVAFGDSTTQDKYPFLVSIRNQNLSSFCGATMIDGNRQDKTVLLLTAAHCVCKSAGTPVANFKDLLIVYGGIQGTKTYTSDSMINTIDTVACHPDYQLSINNDIAIIKVKRPFYYDDPGPKSIQWLKDTRNLEGSTCTMAGWGLPSMQPAAKVETQQELKAKIMTQADCALEVRRNAETRICLTNDSASICFGDSGGPIVCKIDGKIMTVAVLVSVRPVFREKIEWCAQGSKATAHPLSIYGDWIQQTINKIDPMSQAEVDCEVTPGTRRLAALICIPAAARARDFDPDSCKMRSVGKFSGKQYVEIAKGAWNPHAETKIRLSFKTTTSDGLIFFMEVKDFFAIQIWDGHLSLVYNLGGGEAQMNSTAPLNDGYWHEIIILRSGPGALMLVDGEIDAVKRVAGPASYIDLGVGNSYFIGGLNRTHGRRNVTKKGFQGCIKKLKVGETYVNIHNYTSVSSPPVESECKPNSGRRRQHDQPINKQRPSIQGGRAPKITNRQPPTPRRSPKELAQKGLAGPNHQAMQGRPKAGRKTN